MELWHLFTSYVDSGSIAFLMTLLMITKGIGDSLNGYAHHMQFFYQRSVFIFKAIIIAMNSDPKVDQLKDDDAWCWLLHCQVSGMCSIMENIHLGFVAQRFWCSWWGLVLLCIWIKLFQLCFMPVDCGGPVMVLYTRCTRVSFNIISCPFTYPKKHSTEDYHIYPSHGAQWNHDMSATDEGARAGMCTSYAVSCHNPPQP